MRQDAELGARRRVPDTHGAVDGGRCEAPSVGVEGDVEHGAFVAGKAPLLGPRLAIPEAHGPVRPAGRDPPGRRVDRDPEHGRLVAARTEDDAPRLDVPDPYGPVLRAGHEPAAVRHEGDAPDGEVVTSEDADLAAAPGLPEPDRPVVARRGERPTVRGEVEADDRSVVSAEPDALSVSVPGSSRGEESNGAVAASGGESPIPRESQGPDGVRVGGQGLLRLARRAIEDPDASIQTPEHQVASVGAVDEHVRDLDVVEGLHQLPAVAVEREHQHAAVDGDRQARPVAMERQMPRRERARPDREVEGPPAALDVPHADAVGERRRHARAVGAEREVHGALRAAQDDDLAPALEVEDPDRTAGRLEGREPPPVGAHGHDARAGRADVREVARARPDEPRRPHVRLEQARAVLGIVVEGERLREEDPRRRKVALGARAVRPLEEDAREVPGRLAPPLVRLAGPLGGEPSGLLGGETGRPLSFPRADRGGALPLRPAPLALDPDEGGERAREREHDADGDRRRDRAVPLRPLPGAAEDALRIGGDGPLLEPRLDVVRERAGARVPIAGGPGHRLHADRVELARDGRIRGARVGRVEGEDLGDDLGGRPALEGRPARQGVMERRPERVHVRVRTDPARVAARLLGRHVGGRAHDRPRLRLDAGPFRADTGRGGVRSGRARAGRLPRPLGIRPGEHLREAPVHHLDLAVAPDHDVLRLEIAVDDAALVGVVDGPADLDEDLEEPEPRELPRGLGIAGVDLLDDPRERPAADELHREEEAGVVGEADLVDGHDPGVLELRGRLGLLDEPVGDLPVGAELAEEGLHGDVAAQVAVEGAVDDPHAAAPDLLLDEVAPGRTPPGGRAGRGPLVSGKLDAHGDAEGGSVGRRLRKRTRRVLVRRPDHAPWMLLAAASRHQARGAAPGRSPGRSRTRSGGRLHSRAAATASSQPSTEGGVPVREGEGAGELDAGPPATSGSRRGACGSARRPGPCSRGSSRPPRRPRRRRRPGAGA